MRLRPVIASVAMLSILGSVVWWAGGEWFTTAAVLVAVVLFAYALVYVTRGLYDDDWD